MSTSLPTTTPKGNTQSPEELLRKAASGRGLSGDALALLFDLIYADHQGFDPFPTGGPWFELFKNGYLILTLDPKKEGD